MENTIGNLGREIKQPSNLYHNLSEHGVRCCQLNALKAMLPDLMKPEIMSPHGSFDLGGGHILLWARDQAGHLIQGFAGRLIRVYIMSAECKLGNEVPVDWHPKIVRWAWLRLPSSQIARSAWKEEVKLFDKLWRS